MRHFWSQIQAFLFFRNILPLDKFDDADFKYDNIVFKFQPQNTQIGHFWSEVRDFCFFVKFCKQKNLRVLILNITIVFLQFFPKNTQIRHFWSQIQGLMCFRKILQLEKLQGADFKYDNSIFKILAQKYINKAFLVKNMQISHFCSQIQAFLFFRDILQLDKFEGADFKYGNSFQILAPKYPNQAFLVPSFCQKYPSKAFLIPNLGISVSSQYLTITLIRRCLFQI